MNALQEFCTDTSVQNKAEECWDTFWSRFYNEKLGMIYDYLSSYDHERRFEHLPRPDEIARHLPNTCGWATGMEDSTLNSGVALAMVCDRYAVTGEESLRALAASLFDGLERCGTYSKAPGLVLRSICLFDEKSYYVETSRDQYTLFAWGLWHFYHSPLSSPQQRQSIADMMVNVCRRMEATITPENDYRFLMEDGRRGLVDKMWECDQHEVARLPMLYAIAHQLTGDPHWRAMHDVYAWDAARIVTAPPEKVLVGYALLQAQISYEVLYAVEQTDMELKAEWLRAMQIAIERAAEISVTSHDYVPIKLEGVETNWRKWGYNDGWMREHGYAMPDWPSIYMTEMNSIRDPGEGALMQLICPGNAIPQLQIDRLKKLLLSIDYPSCFTYSMIYPIAAYWRAARVLAEAAESRDSSDLVAAISPQS